MIRISSNRSRDLEYCNEIHYQNVQPGVAIRLEHALQHKAISKCQYEFIRDNLRCILKGGPKELMALSKEYRTYCKNRRCTNTHKGLEGIFAYKVFSRKHPSNYCAYSLAEILDVRVCPYCNRQYTFTIVNKKEQVSRPEFDHFFSKVDHPLLAMSFYNLIPCCKICNSTLKHTKKFSLDQHLHPYLYGFDEAVTFSYNPSDALSAIGMSNDLTITVNIKTDHALEKQIKGNLQVFKIAEVYQGHTDVVAEVIRKFYMSEGRYLETLVNNYPIGSYEELYRLAFGNYYSTEHMDKRALSKLIRDTVDYLDFILPVNIE